MNDKEKIENAIIALRSLYVLVNYLDETIIELRDETQDELERDYFRPLRFLCKRELKRVIEDLEKE